jgi:hypothetical protein
MEMKSHPAQQTHSKLHPPDAVIRLCNPEFAVANLPTTSGQLRWPKLVVMRREGKKKPDERTRREKKI